MGSFETKTGWLASRGATIELDQAPFERAIKHSRHGRSPRPAGQLGPLGALQGLQNDARPRAGAFASGSSTNSGAGQTSQGKDRLSNLPVEMQQAIIGELDGAAMANVARMGRRMWAAAIGHPEFETTTRAEARSRIDQLMEQLDRSLEDPKFQPDQATLEKIRRLSPFFTPGEIEHLVAITLAENDYHHGRGDNNRAKLLGAVISGRSAAEAESAAQKLDGVVAGPSYSSGEEDGEKHNNEARSKLLCETLASLKKADYAVYAPFLSRLRDDNIYDGKLTLDICDEIANMPTEVREELCRVALSVHPWQLAGLALSVNTRMMYEVQKHLSPEAQEEIFKKAKESYDASLDPREMRITYSPDKEYNDQIFEGLPLEIRSKWIALFESEVDPLEQSRRMWAAVIGHPEFETTTRAEARSWIDQSMERLDRALGDPEFQPDYATLGKIHRFSAFFTPEEVERLVAVTLADNDYYLGNGRNKRARLLGVVISGRSAAEAAFAAQKLDEVVAPPIYMSGEKGNKLARSRLLRETLASLGTADDGVYAPFLRRLGNADAYNGKVTSDICDAIPYMPQEARDKLCRVALSADPSQFGELPRFNVRLMYGVLKHLSSGAQEEVFQKAKELYAIASNRLLALDCSPGAESSDHIFEGLPPEVRGKWKALFAS